ncbi:MAG: UDP-N-acetylglucosamine 1-carboxyvinyltransferase [Mesorhizobium sp.]|nr:MAG: UDP-N-acetylglucosamine 1-carboxyvinyltransferase [Mesorhizobium sp.]
MGDISGEPTSSCECPSVSETRHSPDLFGRRVLHVSASRLRGRVAVSGAKNSALPLMAASLLTSEPIILQNYPNGALDPAIQVAMLERIGKSCTVAGTQLTISEDAGLRTCLKWHGRSTRYTLLMLGAMVARFGEGAVPLPSGCEIGDRKYDIHELVLKRLGAEVWVERGMLCASSGGGLTGCDIRLPIRSTGATENALLCASLANGVTTVWNPHIRPEVLDLVSMLRKMGAQIEVCGQQYVRVTGRDPLSGTTHTVIPDNLEAITWLIAATVTGGEIEIENFPSAHLEVPLIFLRESGARFHLERPNLMRVAGGYCYPIDISTGPYPGINSDMQPLFAAFGARAHGESRIIDLRFPGRFDYVHEFSKLGVRGQVREGMLCIDGGSPMKGTDVTAVDLRAGMALALLGLTTGGETRIHDAWQMDRGYVNLTGKLRSLGANAAVHT